MEVKNYVKVDYKDRKKAKACGADFDWDKKSWYVGNEELFWLEFTRKTKLEREYDMLSNKMDKLCKVLIDKKNSNIKDEIDKLELERIKLMNLIKDDKSVMYYIAEELKKENINYKPKNLFRTEPKPKVEKKVSQDVFRRKTI